MQLVTVAKAAISSLSQMVLEQLELLSLISADEALVSGIASQLRYSPRTWLFFPQNHELYHQMVSDIREIYPKLPDNAVIIASATHRWTLVACNGHVLPFIFINKGGFTSLYRLIRGRAIRWLPVLFEEMHTLALSRGWKALSQRDQGDLEDMRFAQAPKRDRKWEIGGVFLDDLK